MLSLGEMIRLENVHARMRTFSSNYFSIFINFCNSDLALKPVYYIVWSGDRSPLLPIMSRHCVLTTCGLLAKPNKVTSYCYTTLCIAETINP